MCGICYFFIFNRSVFASEVFCDCLTFMMFVVLVPVICGYIWCFGDCLIFYDIYDVDSGDL